LAHGSRSRFQRGGGSSPRQTEWGDGPIDATVQSITAAGTTIVGTGQLATIKQTIVRIRGAITLWLPVVTAIGDGFSGVTVGIGIVSFEAFTAGAGSMPSPISDPDWPGWIYYENLGAFVGLETTEVARGPMGAARVVIDTKAMRKIGINEIVFGAVAATAEVGTATLSFVMRTRMLAKLH